MRTNVARRPRFKRIQNFPKIQITERDKRILSALCRYRFLTTSQIQKLAPGSPQNISRRLQRLYHSGFLDRPASQLPLRFAGMLSEIVYSPNRESFRQCQDKEMNEARNTRPISAAFLSHALILSRITVEIESECKKRGLRYLNEQEIIRTIPELKGKRRLSWRVRISSEGRSVRAGVYPDAVFEIDRKIRLGVLRYFYFLEVDRGTMPLHRNTLLVSSIERKALAYIRTRKTKLLEAKYGIPGFQVVFISRSKKRLDGIKDVCCKAENNAPTSLFFFGRESAFEIIGEILPTPETINPQDS